MVDMVELPLSDLNVFESQSWGCTDVQIVTCSYTWVIKNFSSCAHKVGEKLESPRFYAGPNRIFVFTLRLFPMGRRPKSKDYVSAYLGMVSCDYQNPEVWIKFKINFLNSNEEIIKTLSGENLFKESISKGWPKFLDRSKISNESEVLPGDELIIKCEISTGVEKVYNYCQPESVVMGIPKCTLAEDFELLLASEKFSDLTIHADGKEFKVHKAILVSRSPVFAAMFEHEMAETKRDRVEIIDFDKDVVNSVLHFMYTDIAPLMGPKMALILQAADKYGLDRLKAICEENLMVDTTVEDVADVLLIADTHGAQMLKKHCLDFIRSNATRVLNTEGWRKNLRCRHSLVEEVLKSIITDRMPSESVF